MCARRKEKRGKRERRKGRGKEKEKKKKLDNFPNLKIFGGKIKDNL
jgi:hypothetical protein